MGADDSTIRDQPDQQPVHDEARAWYRDHWDPQRRLGEWWDLLADSGWAFPAWPRGLGGRGLGTAAARAADRARVEVGAFGPPSGIATFLAAPTIFAYGTPEQIERFVPSIVRGRDVWCQLFSEPGSGSDLAGLSTRAERDGDEWVVTGQKVWNSGAQHADYAILMARTDPDQPKHRGISYFLIDMRQDGVEVRGLREMTGDVAFNEVFLTEARVPDSQRLGSEGEGWRVAMTTLSFERDPGNDGLGANAAFDRPDLDAAVGEHAAKLAGRVEAFGMALSGGADGLLAETARTGGADQDPVVRQELMRILAARRTASWSIRRASDAVKAGGQPGPEVSTLKLSGTDVARRTRDQGLAAMGPAGMLNGDDAPTGGRFQAYALFTPALSIAGGSDEIQRNIAGERVLGLPREPGEAEQRDRPWSELPRN